VQLERVLRRVMAPQRDDRHADGAALATELRLCLLPRSLELMRAPEGGWRRLVLRYPVAAVLMAALVPNALAGMFNYYYNHRAIIDPIAEESPELIAVFESTVLAINSVAFPLGIVISILIVRPIAVALRRPNDRSSPAVVDGRIARRALRLAHYAAIVGILEWGIAGLTYPLVLHMLVPALPLSTYWKFMLSLAISGLIAAAYPFFLVLRYSLRVLYPALLQQWPALEVDRRGLAATSRIAGVYLLMAGTVPMLGVLALVFISQQQQTVQLALGIVVAAGLYGFFRAWLMYRSSQHDINALIAVGAPPDSPMPEQAA
jgi:hypothetical protein